MSRIPSLSSVQPWQSPMGIPNGMMPDTGNASILGGIGEAVESVGGAVAAVSLDALREQNQADFFAANAEFKIKANGVQAEAAKIDDIVQRESFLRDSLSQARDEIKKKFPTRYVQDRFAAGADVAISEASAQLKTAMAETDRQNRVSSVMNSVSDLFWVNPQDSEDMLKAAVQSGIVQQFQADAVWRELNVQKESIAIDAALRGPNPDDVMKVPVKFALQKWEQAKSQAAAVKSMNDVQKISLARAKDFTGQMNTARAMGQNVSLAEIETAFFDFVDGENFSPEQREHQIKALLLPELQILFEDSLAAGEIRSRSDLAKQPWIQYFPADQRNALNDQVDRYNNEIVTQEQRLREDDLLNDIAAGKVLPIGDYRKMVIDKVISFQGYTGLAGQVRTAASKDRITTEAIGKVNASLGIRTTAGSTVPADRQLYAPQGASRLVGDKDWADASNIWYTAHKGQTVGEAGLGSVFTGSNAQKGQLYIAGMKTYIDRHKHIPPDAVADFQSLLRDVDTDASGMAKFLDPYVYGPNILPDVAKQLGEDSLRRIKTLRGSKTDADVAKANASHQVMSDSGFQLALRDRLKMVPDQKRKTFGFDEQVEYLAAGMASQGMPPDHAIKASIDHLEKQFSSHYDKDQFQSPLRNLPSEQWPAATDLMVVQAIGSRLGLNQLSNAELAEKLNQAGFSASDVTNTLVDNQKFWGSGKVYKTGGTSSRPLKAEDVYQEKWNNMSPLAPAVDPSETDYSKITRQDMIYFAFMTGALGDPNMKGASAEEKVFFLDWKKNRMTNPLDLQKSFLGTGMAKRHPLQDAHDLSRRFFDLGYSPYPSSRPGEWLLSSPGDVFDSSGYGTGFTSVDYTKFEDHKMISRLEPSSNAMEKRVKAGDGQSGGFFSEVFGQIGDSIMDFFDMTGTPSGTTMQQHFPDKMSDYAP